MQYPARGRRPGLYREPVRVRLVLPLAAALVFAPAVKGDAAARARPVPALGGHQLAPGSDEALSAKAPATPRPQARKLAPKRSELSPAALAGGATAPAAAGRAAAPACPAARVARSSTRARTTRAPPPFLAA